MTRKTCVVACVSLLYILGTNWASGQIAHWRFEDSVQSNFNSTNLVTTQGSAASFSVNLPGDPVYDTTGTNFTNTKSFRNGSGTSTSVSNWATLNSVISSGGFTIEAFVKLDNGGAFTFDQIIGNLNGAGTQGWVFGFDGSGKLRFGSPQTNDGAYKQVLAPSALTAGVWHHVAVVGLFTDRTGTGSLDFTDISLYVDYAQVGTPARFFGSTGTGQTGVKGPVLVENTANYTIVSVNPLDGLVDEIRISDVPRSTTQFLHTDYKPLVDTPVLTPPGGSYFEAQEVTMTCDAAGAQIYYTTNGNIPTTSDNLYTEPVMVDHAMVLKARAFASGYTPSDTKIETYTFINENIAYWRFENSFQSIFNSSSIVTTQGSTALFTVNIPGSPVYDTVATYTNTKGYKNGSGSATTVKNWSVLNSVISSSGFTIEAFVKLNPSGSNTFNQIIGNLNTLGTQGWSFGLDTSGKLRFYAVDANSNVGKNCTAATALTTNIWHHVAVVGNFTDKTGNDLVDYVDVDLYVDYIKVNATTARFYGPLSTGNSGVKGPVTIESTGDYQIGASNPFNGVIDELRISDTPRGTFQFLVAEALPQVATPVLTPAGGSFTETRRVTMSCATPESQIYYTTDGTDPEYGLLYTEPVTVDHRMTIKAQAFASGCVPSEIRSETFIVNLLVSSGHTYLLEKGLQILAVGSITDWDCWNESNFTTAHLAFPFPSQLPSGILYSQQTNDIAAFPMLPLYWDRLVSIKYKDEQRFRDPTTHQLTGEIEESQTFMNHIRTNFPGVRALLYTNQWGDQETPGDMLLYMNEAQPDMLCFDTYPFSTPTPPAGGSPTDYYGHLQKYRLLGLGGNDGTGSLPIPCGLYLDCFKDDNFYARFPSDSEMRLNQFSAWVFGFKFVDAYVYTSMSGNDSIFFDADTMPPSPAFFQMAETNRQSRNLAPSLVRLISKDIRMIPGSHDSGTINSTPAGVTTGIAGADRYLTGVTATNLGSKNNVLPGDVFVGFFKPLHESLDGKIHSNQTYFMVVNGLTDSSGTVSETRQEIRLTFNMGSSEISSLQRLSRETGDIEIVGLTSDGNGIYHLDVVLDGGTGDLFKYNTGAPFVGIETIPEGNIPGDANGDGMVDVGDLGILAANYGGSDKIWTQGDFNGDGLVDVGDLGILAAHYGEGAKAAVDFDADYAKAFATTVAEENETIDSIGSICSGLGLPLIAGLALMGLMLIKIEE